MPRVGKPTYFDEPLKLAGKGHRLFASSHNLSIPVQQMFELETPEDLWHYAQNSHAILTNT